MADNRRQSVFAKGTAERFPGKPFLFWAGGKQRILPALERALPADFDRCTTYVEPFAGGAALFFRLRQRFPDKRYVLNDYNAELIDAYRVVRDNLPELLRLLREIRRTYRALPSREARKEYFLRQRECYNGDVPDKVQRTALLLFLNRTCFRAKFTVNASGKLTSAFGSDRFPLAFDEAALTADSALLQGVELTCGDFSRCLEHAAPGAFFYLDPPYRPLKDTARATAYTRVGFRDDEQERLKRCCDELTRRDARWLQSNSDGRNAAPPNQFLETFYREYHIGHAAGLRYLGKVRSMTELLIANYPIPSET